MPRKLIELTDEQRAIIDEHYDKEDLMALTQRVFGRTTTEEGRPLDGRSNEGYAVKMYLAGRGLVVRTTAIVPVPKVELSEFHREFIRNNAHAFMGKTLELTRLVFEDPKIASFSREWKAVFAYIKEVFPDGVNANEEPVGQKEYQPPVRLQQVVGLVNQYVPTGTDKKVYEYPIKKHTDEKCIRKLMAYMNNYRFKYRATQMTKLVDRELFISTFIRFTYDKPDLTEIEIDQFISAANETVLIETTQRKVDRIDKYHEELLSGNAIDPTTNKPVKFTMNEVEMLNQTLTKLEGMKARLKTITDNLEQVRIKRVDERTSKYSSILSLFEVWQKDEDRRNDLIDMGLREKLEDAKEVGRLRDWDDTTALISGQTEDEGRS